MKLAEALIERADLQRKVESLRNRLYANARVQEGTEPAENPAELEKELDEVFDRLEYLICAINATNAATYIDVSAECSHGGKKKERLTVCELIARKDMLSRHISVLESTLDSASSIAARATHAEIRILPTLNAKSLQKKIDALSKQLRAVDTQIQAANWVTEVIEE